MVTYCVENGHDGEALDQAWGTARLIQDSQSEVRQ